MEHGLKRAGSRYALRALAVVIACGLYAACTSAPQHIAAPAVASAPVPRSDEGTTYLDAVQLADRLRHNLVRIDSRHIGEHGFGLVVGADERNLYVLTARHVVAGSTPQATPPPASGEVTVRPCAAGAAARPVAAQLVEGFDAGREDLALLKLSRPSGYEPLRRALAAVEHVLPRDEAWLLGRDGECVLVPRAGAVGKIVGNDLLIDLTGVRGGSSGAPMLTGRGIVGIVKDSDEVVVVTHAIAHAQRLARDAGPWLLEDARNVPPTDPLAAQMDLAETLNRYLFAVRDVHALLQQSAVARQTFTSQVGAYNAAVERFRDARQKYDGTLRRYWPAAVAEQWSSLRDLLWGVHLKFFELNAHNPQIWQTEHTTPALRAAMLELEPRLQSLDSGIRAFLASLAVRSSEHVAPPP